jgi:hypothetical protein
MGTSFVTGIACRSASGLLRHIVFGRLRFAGDAPQAMGLYTRGLRLRDVAGMGHTAMADCRKTPQIRYFP